jgi:SMI1 / KNR4 family (SUKH-1)
VSGVTEADLDRAERELGVPLPRDYREQLGREDGSARFYGDVYVAVHPLATMLTINRDALDMQREVCPGFVIFGSDGGREAIGWDYRSDPPPVVLVSITTEDWSDALHQAPTFTDFMERIESGQGFRWA